MLGAVELANRQMLGAVELAKSVHSTSKGGCSDLPPTRPRAEPIDDAAHFFDPRRPVFSGPWPSAGAANRATPASREYRRKALITICPAAAEIIPCAS
jgi:hypothetical protein